MAFFENRNEITHKFSGFIIIKMGYKLYCSLEFNDFFNCAPSSQLVASKYQRTVNFNRKLLGNIIHKKALINQSSLYKELWEGGVITKNPQFFRTEGINVPINRK